MKKSFVSAAFTTILLSSGCGLSDHNSTPSLKVQKENDLKIGSQAESSQTLSNQAVSSLANGDEHALMVAGGDTLEGSGLIFVDCDQGKDSNSGTTSSMPFKTIAKARAHLLNSGGLMLRRGATCYETLAIDLSASSNKSTFTIGAFGPGDAPAYMFSAPLKTLKWTRAKDISINGIPVPYLKNTPIYSADVPYRAAQILDSKLIPQPQARHPNNDWEFLSGVSAVQEGDSWFAPTVPVYAFAEFGVTRNETVTYRLNNWFAQKFPVWAYTKATSLLELSKAVDPVYRGTALPNYGYRLQNSLAALDTPGEWYQDYSGGGKIYYWSTTNTAPSGRFLVPKAVDVIYITGGKRSVVIRDVDIIGSGGNGIRVTQLPAVKIDKVGVWASNEYGIMIWKVPIAEVRNSKVNSSNKTGIKADDLSNVVIADNSLENNGRFATQAEIGMELDGIRVATVTTSSRVQNNLIKGSGYAGISAGDLTGSAIISKNDIQGSCLYLNDCGAIYLPGQSIKAPIQVTENKISNSVGNQSGGGGEGDMATGIYLDWVLSNSTISKNVIVNADNPIHGSIFVHGGSNNIISGNIITVSSPDMPGIATLTEGHTGSVPSGNVFERNSCVFPAGTNGNCILHGK